MSEEKHKNGWPRDDAKARVLLLEDARVVVPIEYQGNSYICVVLYPRGKANTIVQTRELLAAREIEV